MKRVLCLGVVVCLPATPARGYIDGAPTLGWLVREATSVVVLRVDRVSREKRVVWQNT